MLPLCCPYVAPMLPLCCPYVAYMFLLILKYCFIGLKYLNTKDEVVYFSVTLVSSVFKLFLIKKIKKKLYFATDKNDTFVR